MENRKFIPNHLRRSRRVRGLTQKQVAAIMDLRSTSMISRWEAGACLPETINLLSLAIVYRTSTEGLLFDFMRELRARLIQREENVFGQTEK